MSTVQVPDRSHSNSFYDVGGARRRSSTQVDEHDDGDDERAADHQRGEVAGPGSPSLRPKTRIRGTRRAAGQGSARRRRASAQPFSSARSSAVAPGRRRRIDTMMPRPTTTSAAATTSTKNTAVWPSMSSSCGDERDEREVDRVEHQLDAHEHARAGCAAPARRRRRCRTARRRGSGTTSVVGRRPTAITARSPSVALWRLAASAGEQHRAGDGDDEQHRRELEREHVVAEQVVRQLPGCCASWAPGARSADDLADSPTSRCRELAGRHDRRDQQRRRSPTPTTAASGRWILNGSTRRSSAVSTPRSMITNRNSTTIAPA